MSKDEEAKMKLSQQKMGSCILDLPAPPPELSKNEAALFYLVKTSSMEKVAKLLLSLKYKDDFSYKINNHGNTIWHIAVHQNDDEMLRYLLNLEVDQGLLYDLLLHATQGHSIATVEIILESIRAKNPSVMIPSQLKRWKYSKFSKDITPIILSAQVGNYNLIKYFFGIGEDFQPVHSRANLFTDAEDLMGISKNFIRLHEYEALASPEMLSYRTHTVPDFDPVREGFHLLVELKRVGKEEHEFHDDYLKVRVKLKKFICKLLDECRSTADMKLLLSQKPGNHGSQDKYPRLIMAMENKFHEFVIHPHCQKMLYMHWAGDSWPAWKARGSFWKCFQIMMRFFFTPFICFWLYIDYFSNWGKFFQSPVNLWIHHFISYIYFMILLALEAYLLSQEGHANVHNTPSKFLEILIILFVLGQLVSVIVHFKASPTNYFSTAWHWYDMTTTLFFLVTFGFWFRTWYNQYTVPITTPRTHWVYYDSVLCGEAIFAVSVILAYGKFMRYFQLSYKTGPLQIAMANMVEDISIFIFFFAVIMLSFALGFSFLYSPFAGEIFTTNGRPRKMAESFTTFPQALYTLYWGTLSMALPQSAEMVDLLDMGESLDSEEVEIMTEIEHTNSVYLVEMVGQALWMFYHLLGPMLIMNMLTGYMGNTFNRIEENMDATWKYNRSQVWVYYMRNTVLPAPFNLIPSLCQLLNFYTWLSKGKGKTQSEEETQESLLKIQNTSVRYCNLMRRLTTRYLRLKLSTCTSQGHPATQKDIQNIHTKVHKLKSGLTFLSTYN